ncbi:hypothetical protein GCM10028862_12770 [Luteimonas pelagia]
MSKFPLVTTFALLLVACGDGREVESGAQYGDDAAADVATQTAAPMDEGAVASEPVEGTIALPAGVVDWSEVPLASGTARIDCTVALDDPRAAAPGDAPADDAATPGDAVADAAPEGESGGGDGDAVDGPLAVEGSNGEGEHAAQAGARTAAADPDAMLSPLVSLDRESIEAALVPCVDAGAIRLHYRGKIEHDFTALMQRVAEVADEAGIRQRLLDIDSTGGHIEDAIRSGDAIAEGGWTIRVREGAVCHSSCVLVLAGGDMRLVAGRVGVHRMVRIGSSATSRAELDRELRDTLQEMRDYLQRNGASATIADLMTTVPNHGLKLLTGSELDAFGLTGRNAAEEDLQRIELARRCGEDFVRRRDAFFRAFRARCNTVEGGVDEVNACAAGLGDRYGFPDDRCPEDGPVPSQAAALVRLEERYADARADADRPGQGGLR